MSSEKRPNIAAIAVAAATILCLFIYTSGRQDPEPSEAAETMSSIALTPMGGRIEIKVGQNGLVEVEPRDVDPGRSGEAAAPVVKLPDAIDVAAAQASEARAAQTLRIISMAQEKLREARSIDTNGDTLGEYGYLAELMGTAPLRSVRRDSLVDISELNAFLPLKSAQMISTSEGGACEVGGYLYAMYLPATPLVGGQVEGLQEALHGGCGESIPDPNQSALRWCAYAWPSTETFPARRAFFLDATGRALSTPNTLESPQCYVGASRAPSWDAAYSRSDMSGPAGGEETCDGNSWRR